MSYVSTVIFITWEYWRAEGGGSAATERAFSFTGMSSGKPMQMNRLRHCDDFGGYKCAECEVYVGAFNWFDCDAWFKHLDQIPLDQFDDPRLTLTVVQSSDGQFIRTWKPTDD